MEHFLFFHISGISDPNWLIFFGGVGSTTNQNIPGSRVAFEANWELAKPKGSSADRRQAPSGNSITRCLTSEQRCQRAQLLKTSLSGQEVRPRAFWLSWTGWWACFLAQNYHLARENARIFGRENASIFGGMVSPIMVHHLVIRLVQDHHMKLEIQSDDITHHQIVIWFVIT